MSRVQAPSLPEFKSPSVQASRPCVQGAAFPVCRLKIIFKTVTEMNCKVFVKAGIIELIITLMFIASLLYIIKIWKFLFPWTVFSFVLKNSCWHEVQSFCGSNHLWAYNHVDSFETFQQSTFRQSIWFVEESSFKVEVTE